MLSFVHQALPTRVIFGAGSLARLPDELRRLGLSRALVLSTPQQADSAQALVSNLDGFAAGSFTGAVMHTPVEVTEAAMAVVGALGVDGIVAVGGGSTTGLGKAIALRTDLPQIVVPTTYAGSEMTDILGETKAGVKTTRRSPAIQPEVVIYDVDLTLGLPPALSVTSGMNAIAHAVEALYAVDGGPMVSLMAESAIAAFAKSLPAILADPGERAAREQALYGAWLCGTCLGMVSMALHHKLCHTLGGTFDLPHAETHTIVLPHATAYNAGAAPEAMARIARALGAPDAARGLYDLAGRLGAPRSLKELGMPEAGIDRAADLAVANPYRNPRPIERDAIRALIARAWAGDPPA
ncbi:maleylacetate reductase [Bosea thiooxidans]